MSVKTQVKKAVRKVEEVVTGKEPEVDILDTLEEEHEVVAGLLQRLVDGSSSAERKSLVKQIKANLLPHAKAEQKVLYNALIAQKDKKIQQDGEEGFIEHELVERVLASLEKNPNAMSPEFGAAAKVLKELVEHHVKDEETAVWSDAKNSFSSEERKALNARYLREKEKVRV